MKILNHYGLHLKLIQINYALTNQSGFSDGTSGKEPACQCRRHKRLWFDPRTGGEDPLEEAMATHPSILAWRIPQMRSLAGYSLWGHKESDTTERLSTHTHTIIIKCTISVICLNHPQTISPPPVHGKPIFHKPGLWYQKGWGPMNKTFWFNHGP